MKLYEIDREIEALVDENGEIADVERLNELWLERDAKIENIACLCKNLKAEAEAIKAEEDKLKERRQAKENSLKRLKEYLSCSLKGEKFESARVKIYSRSTSSVELDDEFLKWAAEDAPELLRWRAPEPDKSKIKERIADGHEVPHARISDSMSVIIK